jgi:arylsulfatase A-like enzyme
MRAETVHAMPSPLDAKLTRRQWLAGAGLAPTALKRPPNIVFILADDLGWGDLGCYGQRWIRTPNLDRMAREGTRFTDAYAGCTVCAPSRSVLMTGFHMGHTSVRANTGGIPLRPEDVTVAEVLKQAGYATGCFGKWGLGDIGTEGVPWKQGFDEFFGYLHQVHAHFYYPPYLWENDRKFPLPGNQDGKRTTYSHDVIAERALDFIRRHRDRPFFCYVAFTIPHLELLVPEDSLAEYRGKIPEDKPYRDPRNHYAPQDYPRAAYAAMITRMDRDVGRILRLLAELGLESSTIVFFTSDNGGAGRLWGDEFFQSWGPFRGHKQNLYEGGIRVPMIVRWPGRVPAGRVSDFAWSFQDFLPTAADLAGIKPPAGIDGISVLPTLLGQRQSPHPYLYWELPRYDSKTGTFPDPVPMQAVRMGHWKAVRPKPGGPVELYDLARDPGETTDLAARMPDLRRKLEELMAQARTPPRPQKEPASEWVIPMPRPAGRAKQ